MARYRHVDTSPRFLAVDLERQLLSGTFERPLNYLVDHELDLRRFDVRYKNDLTGASACPPTVLLGVCLQLQRSISRPARLFAPVPPTSGLALAG